MKKYDDDDGRTIADMSGVERPPLLVPAPLKKKFSGKSSPEMSKGEGRSYIFGALGAGLAIAAVFIAVFAVLILVLLKIW